MVAAGVVAVAVVGIGAACVGPVGTGVAAGAETTACKKWQGLINENRVTDSQGQVATGGSAVFFFKTGNRPSRPKTRSRVERVLIQKWKNFDIIIKYM